MPVSDVPTLNKSVSEYFLVRNEAERQLDWGTDPTAIGNAADALRSYDPNHPLLPALDRRAREAVRIHLLVVKSRLATQRNSMQL
jgi:hypothetical protein